MKVILLSDSSMSTVKIGSDSDKSENFEELSGPDTDANSTDSNEHKLNNDYFDNNLPETVTLLKNPNTGAKVYLVGTAHFSKESQDDVSLVSFFRNLRCLFIHYILGHPSC